MLHFKQTTIIHWATFQTNACALSLQPELKKNVCISASVCISHHTNSLRTSR